MYNENLILKSKLITSSLIVYFCIFIMIISIIIFSSGYVGSNVIILLFLNFILSIIEINKIIKLPRCKVIEFHKNRLYVYSYTKKGDSRIKYDINLDDITRYYLSSYGKTRNQRSALKIITMEKEYIIYGESATFKKDGLVNYPIMSVKKNIDRYLISKSKDIKVMNMKREQFAKYNMQKYLVGNNINFFFLSKVNIINYINNTCYIYRFKINITGKWKVGICGISENRRFNQCNFVIYSLEDIIKENIYKKAKHMVENN